MKSYFNAPIRLLSALALVSMLAACEDTAGDPRAVLLPLQYPDGQPVLSKSGAPIMAGYQTYGSSVHANTTALYQHAASAQCLTCVHIGAVVTEPSVLRQVTGFVGVSTVGAGAILAGAGALDGGFNTRVNENNVTNTSSAGGNGNGGIGVGTGGAGGNASSSSASQSNSASSAAAQSNAAAAAASQSNAAGAAAAR